MNELHIDLGDLLASMRERGLPDPATVSYYQNLERRTLVWNQEVTDDILSIADYIIRWNQDDSDRGLAPSERMPITIMINTPGGDLESTQFVCDIIEASTTPVYTVGMATCYSAGGLLLMCGHPGKRWIHKSTKFLLHDGYSEFGGAVSKVKDVTEFYEKNERRVKEFVLAHTKITSEEFDENKRRDWFMDAKDIIKYGIADDIVTKI